VTEPEFTRELRELIDHHLGSIDEIEVLLTVFARRGELMAPADVATATQKPESAAREHLKQLAARGFVVHHEMDDAYSYPTRAGDTDGAIEQLSRMYNERPVTLIRALYDRPSTAVRSFADAFRLRHD
jgi:predicted ArsR family transcriptional regulator